jgi:hypothetical protein
VRHAARTDANQSEIVEAMRKAGAYVWLIGLPVDALVGCNGRTALLEFKTATGRKTKLQRTFFEDWTGGTLALVSDVESALRVVAMLKGTA